MTDRMRSRQAPQGNRSRLAADEAGADQQPLWVIALPTFACTVVLSSYLILTIVSRLI